MNRLVRNRVLAPLALFVTLASTACVAAVGAAAGYVVYTQVLPNNVHVAQVSIDVDKAWPSVKETLTFFQSPGTELTIHDFPRTIEANVEGSKVLVAVEADDIDRTTIRVTAEKYLAKDDTTASEVMSRILDRLGEL